MDITDQELFDSAVSGEPQGETGTTTQELPADAGQPRDDQGRFAPRSSDAAPQPSAEPNPEPQPAAQGEAHVPPGRLREEAEARRRAEAEAAAYRAQVDQLMARLAQPQAPQQPQAPAEAPDWYVDPNAAFQHAISPHFQQIQQVNAALTREIASLRHTDAVVDEAEKAFLAAYQSGRIDPADAMRVIQAPNRYTAAVEWHKRSTLLSEIGNDPQAFRQKIIDDALNDPAILARAVEKVRQSAGQPQAGAAPTIQLPPSLNRQTSAAPTVPAGGGNDVSDAALFSEVTARRR